jgi:aryl-alcohol dehydrogenase-like predicted oxidoreductase
MQFRPLGSTGLAVSAVSFGAGPVSGLMTSAVSDNQRAVIARAIALGVNWFDTAATYGDGRSESSLGEAFSGIRTDQPLHVPCTVATPPTRWGTDGSSV